MTRAGMIALGSAMLLGGCIGAQQPLGPPLSITPAEPAPQAAVASPTVAEPAPAPVVAVQPEAAPAAQPVRQQSTPCDPGASVLFGGAQYCTSGG